MATASKRRAVFATWFIFFLSVPLLYTMVSRSNLKPLYSWKKNQLLSRTGVRSGENRGECLEFLMKGKELAQLKSTGFSCHTDLRSQQCITNQPLRILNGASTIFLPSKRNLPIIDLAIRPYPLKDDNMAMVRVTPINILNKPINPPTCDFTHHAPAIVFSSGGFTGNLFHEINDIIIPLFVTCRHFQTNLKFIITDFKPSWVKKYSRVLAHLSKYEVINPGKNVHCFPSAVIGLKYHDKLSLNTTVSPYTVNDFKEFLRESYNLKVKSVSRVKKGEKPVLVLLSRDNSRRFLNEDSMVKMMKDLGFEVVVSMPNMTENLDRFADVVNSCSVMVGAHGAGLTNMVFMPLGAVMVQVVPWGLDWAADKYYGAPTRNMGVKYLEYKIEAEESTLVDLYGRDHPVIMDPMSVFVKGYRAARDVYVDGQDLKINVARFRETLVEALKLVGH